MDDDEPFPSRRAVAASRKPGEDSPAPAYGKRGVFTVVGSDFQPAVGNSALVLSSRINLGLNASEFRQNKFIVTLNNKRNIIPTWTGANRMKLALPAGEGGTDALLEIRRDGTVVGSVTVSYLGKVTNASWVADPVTGQRLGTIVGTGLSRTRDWRLTSPDGEGMLDLPMVATREELDELDPTVRGGVLLVRDSQALVQLPADVPGLPGIWSVEFDPVEGSHFAPLAPANKLDVTYLAPRIARLSNSGVSTQGGTELTIHGTNLGSISMRRRGSVVLRQDLRGRQLVEDTGPAAPQEPEEVMARVTAVRQSAVTVIVPKLSAGDYRVVLRTQMGETDDGLPKEKLVAVAPVPGVCPAGRVLGIGGPVVLRTSDLGASPSELTAKKVTAKIDDRLVQLKWLSETTVQVVLPPGPPGTSTEVVLCRHGIPSPPIRVEYAAGITGITRTVMTTAGSTVRVTGVGLSGRWVLHPIAAGPGTERDMPLEDITLDDRGRSAEIDLPPMPVGVYEIRFSPDQQAYPGAVGVFTSKAVVSYSDFG